MTVSEVEAPVSDKTEKSWSFEDDPKWKLFVARYGERITAWIRDHEKTREPLPITVLKDGTYAWICRDVRRKAARSRRK